MKLLILLLSSLSFASTNIPTKTVQLEEAKVSLADQWIKKDGLEIGTIVVETEHKYIVCFQTFLHLNQEIEGPDNCSDYVEASVVDEAIALAYGQ